MKSQYNFLPGIPKLPKDSFSVLSFMFYDIRKPVNENWLQWIESVFEDYGATPEKLIVRSKVSNYSGMFSKLRTKLLYLLAEASEGQEIDFQVRSAPLADGVGFYPSDISISINTNNLHKSQGVFSIRDFCGRDLVRFSTNCAKKLTSMNYQFYGHASKFPGIIGPDFYSASVGSIPKGWSFMSTREYTKRITVWRDEYNSLSQINGFFREIFPINFLNETHLQKHINGMSAKCFYEMFGNVFEIAKDSNQYAWIIDEEKLSFLRKKMEKENLVLSAR